MRLLTWLYDLFLLDKESVTLNQVPEQKQAQVKPKRKYKKRKKTSFKHTEATKAKLRAKARANYLRKKALNNYPDSMTIQSESGVSVGDK